MRKLKADILIVSPSCVRVNHGIVGCVWFIWGVVELRYWWKHGNVKTRMNQLNEKCSLIPWGLSVSI